MDNIELESELTCPECGHQVVETMPVDRCQFYYECEGCGALLRPKPGDCCVFCLDEGTGDDRARLIVHRGEYSYVIMNRYPYSNGHLMVSPYRHLADPAALDENEVLEIHKLLVQCQTVLRESCAAQGFNIGWNIGEAAGAGIAAHMHVHIVPRWSGDSNFMPVLADTRVMPQALLEQYDILYPLFNM